MDKTEQYILPTIYKGIKYRSRTEARWALYFDLLGYPNHTYEPETFILPSGPYLPDFVLHIGGRKIYAEVKGRDFTVLEKKRCRQVSKITKSDFFMFDGVPDFKAYNIITVLSCSCGRTYHSSFLDAHLVDAENKYSPYYWDPICDYDTRFMNDKQIKDFKEYFPDTYKAIKLAQNERFGVYE